MATKIQITGTLLGSLGLRDNSVTATLVDLNGVPRLGFVSDVQSELVSKEVARTDSAGGWMLSLYGNADIESDYGDTLYQITEGPGFNRYGSNVFYVGVPASGGPYWVRDMVVTPPGGSSPETFAVVSVDGRTGVVDLSDRYLGLGGGTLTGALTLSGAPTQSLHAATKAYVDANSGGGSGASGGPFLALAGGTMTGALTLSGAPSSSLHAATKTYVDNETVRATGAEALLAPKASPTFTGTVSGVTKSMVGLGNVDNTADTGKPVSTAQQTALDLKANLASPTFTGTVSGITKSMVGLGNVDNTADTGKPVSTAQQTALDLKANLASPTFTGTVNAAAITTSGTVTVGGNLSVTGIGAIVYVRATSNQSISATAQTASTQLVAAVVANAEYWVEAQILAQNTSGTWTPSWTGPSGATMKWNDTTTSTDYSSTIGATNNTYASNAGVRMCFFAGILKTSGTAGNLTFTTNASTGTTVLQTDSALLLRRVA
ncbi:hypothetical protein OG601_24160 [Streptomyces sp. NBC_01239]|uniref:hypothetical protein n=1 Tax=Streptomyces sp. NBC_01239 TaxID=2903792 RepID=UPI00225BF829|nr:hypothetical protein [Streptomyces sp. NBC_01239]MCX4813697.1 hypothetical protein [Streptomyces sp. NBC_01239]